MNYQTGLKLLRERRERELKIAVKLLESYQVQAQSITDIFNIAAKDRDGFVCDSFIEFLNDLGASAATLKMQIQDKCRELREALESA